MGYKHEELEQAWRGWRRAIRLHPWKSVLLVIAASVLGLIVVYVHAYVSAKGEQLAQVEQEMEGIQTKLSNITEALETLLVAQRIDHIEEDNSILLDYEPIPQSVRITVGPLVHFPRPNYGYRLEGRKIHLLAPQTIERIKGRMTTGGVTVEYLRKVTIPE